MINSAENFFTKYHKGFSLLELMVVVTIIAIMTAIAAVNYQEAIVRSKVSKFYADVKSVEYGIIAYQTDFNEIAPPDRYPVPSECDTWDAEPSHPYQSYLTRRITTPTAYLSKLPSDPFPNNNPNDQGTCFPEDRRAFFYSHDTFNRREYGGSNSQLFVQRAYHHITDIDNDIFRDGRNAAQYMFWSVGPSNERDLTQDDDIIVYDSSNGVISPGDVFFFGPSIGIPNS